MTGNDLTLCRSRIWSFRHRQILHIPMELIVNEEDEDRDDSSPSVQLLEAT